MSADLAERFGRKKKRGGSPTRPGSETQPNSTPTNDQRIVTAELEENRSRYGFTVSRRMRQGIGFSAALPIPLRKGFHPPERFTRSLAYHTSAAGPALGLSPRPITIHSSLSARSSRSPPSPLSPRIPYYNSYSGFLPAARLFVCPMAGRLGAPAYTRGRHFFLRRHIDTR